MLRHPILSVGLLYLAASAAQAQPAAPDATGRRYFAGSTFFVLGNLVPDDNPPGFAQLNLGYRITPKDVVSIEAKTWKYSWPLGIPYGKSFEAPNERYPGHVRDIGVALVYQRFLWKGVYSSLHAMHAVQRYVDDDGRTIQKGYQLFMTYRLGYHIALSKDRFFVEPSVAATHWPVRTNVPDSFRRMDSRWPNHFLFEPGLHFGFRF